MLTIRYPCNLPEQQLCQLNLLIYVCVYIDRSKFYVQYPLSASPGPINPAASKEGEMPKQLGPIYHELLAASL